MKPLAVFGLSSAAGSRGLLRRMSLMPWATPRHVDNIEYHYLEGKASGVDALKLRGFELADPDDEGAFCVRYARKTSTGVCRPE